LPTIIGLIAALNKPQPIRRTLPAGSKSTDQKQIFLFGIGKNIHRPTGHFVSARRRFISHRRSHLVAAEMPFDDSLVQGEIPFA
jgi:hypothetical protein